MTKEKINKIFNDFNKNIIDINLDFYFYIKNDFFNKIRKLKDDFNKIINSIYEFKKFGCFLNIRKWKEFQHIQTFFNDFGVKTFDLLFTDFFKNLRSFIEILYKLISFNYNKNIYYSKSFLEDEKLNFKKLKKMDYSFVDKEIVKFMLESNYFSKIFIYKKTNFNIWDITSQLLHNFNYDSKNKDKSFYKYFTNFIGNVRIYFFVDEFLQLCKIILNLNNFEFNDFSKNFLGINNFTYYSLLFSFYEKCWNIKIENFSF